MTSMHFTDRYYSKSEVFSDFIDATESRGQSVLCRKVAFILVNTVNDIVPYVIGLISEIDMLFPAGIDIDKGHSIGACIINESLENIRRAFKARHGPGKVVKSIRKRRKKKVKNNRARS